MSSRIINTLGPNKISSDFIYLMRTVEREIESK